MYTSVYEKRVIRSEISIVSDLEMSERTIGQEEVDASENQAVRHRGILNAKRKAMVRRVGHAQIFMTTVPQSTQIASMHWATH
jgi:hypothetical protein